MKFAVLFLAIFGLAAASVNDVFDDAISNVIENFARGVQDAPSLSEFLGLENTVALSEAEEDAKNALIEKLQEVLDKIVQKIKDHLEKKHEIAQNILEHAKDVHQKLKDMGADAKEKTKEIIANIRDRFKSLVEKILEKLGFQKRGLQDFALEMLIRFEMDDIVKEVKRMIVEKLDLNVIREYVEKAVGENKLVQDLFRWMDIKSTEELKTVISYIVDFIFKETRHSRSAVVDVWSKVRELFENLKLETKEKLALFAAWVQAVWARGLEKATSELDKLRFLATVFVEEAHVLGEEIAEEALKVFGKYKEELGDLYYQVVEAVKQLKNKL